MQPVFRFAPSPNGHLHLGHAYSALLNAALADACGGRLLLRIEDIDRARCSETLVTHCQEDLAWLGLVFEMPVLRQSTQFHRYRAAANALEARGLLYPCFCTRGMIAAAGGQGHDPDGAPLYPGTCRDLARDEVARRLEAGEPHALRLDMARAIAMIGKADLAWSEAEWPAGRLGPPADGKAFLAAARRERSEPLAWGDVVLVRKDCPTSYHLSVVLDDALQGVTHIVRGADLFAATAVHRLLQQLLGLPVPLYAHHPLLRDEHGHKLAKSTASKPLRQWREEGMEAQNLRRLVGF